MSDDMVATVTTRNERYAALVAAGIAFIRDHSERFDLDLDRIDPSILQTASGYYCPLAQASGGWYSAVYDRIADRMGSQFDPRELGFECPLTSGFVPEHGGYNLLDDEWVRQLTELRDLREELPQ